MQPARYQEFAPQQIPQQTLADDGYLRIITGQFGDATGPVTGIATQPLYFDVYLPKGSTVDIPVAEEHTALLYCYSGTVSNHGQSVKQGQMAQFGPGSHVVIQAEEDARFLFLAAQPIREPVVQYGPFVMNSHE